jgi:hypothetical protein
VGLQKAIFNQESNDFKGLIEPARVNPAKDKTLILQVS